jgi:hypothetical protein
MKNIQKDIQTYIQSDTDSIIVNTVGLYVGFCFKAHSAACSRFDALFRKRALSVRLVP